MFHPHLTEGNAVSSSCNTDQYIGSATVQKLTRIEGHIECNQI